ncbi:MAG: hypothetical protein IT379_07975, partial [Deltaproteobacteria bacterium]|nr:hypothetical protein [Deltaproteobacteria bacterium]
MMRRALVACALFAASLAAFACVPSHAFLAWDDAGYVASNPRVQEGLTFANVRWALTTFQQTNWHPLTWLSYMLDCTLHGLDPRAHHWTNVW